MIPLKMQNLSRSDEYVELSGQTVDWLARMAGIEVKHVGLGDIVCCKPNPAIGGYTCYDESGRAVWNSAGTRMPVPKLCPPGGAAPTPPPPVAAPPPVTPPPASTPPAMPRPTVPQLPNATGPVGPPPSGLPPCCRPIMNPTNTGWWVECSAPGHGTQDGDLNDPAVQAFIKAACGPGGGINTQTPGTLPPAPLPSLPQAPVPGLPPAGSPPPAPTGGTPPLPRQPFPTFPPLPPVKKPPVYVPRMPAGGVGPAKTVGVPVTLVEKVLRATEDAWKTAMRLVVTADSCDASDVEKVARDKALACLATYKRSAGALRPAMDELCRAKREKRDARLTSAQVKALEDLALCVSGITAAAVQAAAKTGPDWLTTIIGTGLPVAGTAILTAL